MMSDPTKQIEQVLSKPYQPMVRFASAVVAIAAIVLVAHTMLLDLIDTRARLAWSAEALVAQQEHKGFSARLDGHDVQIAELRKTHDETVRILLRIEGRLPAKEHR